jgi:hypothetical protein
MVDKTLVSANEWRSWSEMSDLSSQGDTLVLQETGGLLQNAASFSSEDTVDESRKSEDTYIG